MPPSVATGPHARAARTFARAATAHQTAGRRASIHTKPPSLSSAEAAPVSEAARHEGHGGSQAIANIAARRAKAGKLVAGVAAAAHSDMFKGSVGTSPAPSLGLAFTDQVDMCRPRACPRPSGGRVSLV